MNTIRLVLLTLVTVLLAGCASPDAPEETAAPVRIDGDTSDWADASLRHTDATGDGRALDLGRLWVENDDEHLFVQIEVGDTINLQEGNDLTLVLDTDHSATTGRSAQNLGAELTWTFGRRRGLAYASDGTGPPDTLRHADLGFASLPTTRSSVFEFVLRRDARIDGRPLFTGDSVRIALQGGGDRLPDGSGGVTYALAPPETSAARVSPSLGAPEGATRFLSYNALFGSLFEEDPRPAYQRLLRAMNPDVIGFQEIYDTGADSTRQAVEAMLGAESGQTWHAAKLGLDLVTVSRFPILETHAIAGYESDERHYQSGAFLLDATDALGGPVLYILAHPPCCNYADATPSRDAQRQQVVDGIMAFIRDVKRGDGPFEVPENTPIVVAGDMNFVGSAQQPRTLRTGEIVNTDRFGSSAAPDWDGTDLLDTNPPQTATPLNVTWDDPESSFPPGRLDYTYLSDSVLEVVNEYVLSTAPLPDSVLTAHGLRATDTAVASDHLPVVVDVVRRIEGAE